MDLHQEISSEIEQLVKDINDDVYISIEKLYKHKEIIFNGDREFDYSKLLLKLLCNIVCEKYSQDGSEVSLSDELRNKQGELIDIVLGKSPDLTLIYEVDLEVLAYHQERLLNHPVAPISNDVYLQFVLKARIASFDYEAKKDMPDPEMIKKQGELLKFALDIGGNIDTCGTYSIESLYYHRDLFLNSLDNPGTLLIFILRSIDAHIAKVDQKYIQQGAELFEIIYEFVGKNSEQVLENVKRFNITLVKELVDRSVLERPILLKLILRASGIDKREDKEIFDLEVVEQQKSLLEAQFHMGATIDDLSFEELNIENNHVSVLKLLLEHGLDPRALILANSDREDFTEVLNLAFENNVRITLMALLQYLFLERLPIEAFDLLIGNIDHAIGEPLEPKRILNEFASQGSKFKEHLDEMSKYASLEEILRSACGERGTLLHVLVNNNQEKLVRHFVTNYTVDINALNALGQTPLFFVQTPEITQFLIENGADLSIKDKKGNSWVSKPALAVLEYAIANKYLAEDYAEKVALTHFAKGNYEHAAKLMKSGAVIKSDPLEQIINAIDNGLKSSIEKNKYQVILHLIKNAGIKIPSEFSYLLNSVSDDHAPEEFNFLNGLIHKLAEHYINLAKASMAKTLGESEELDSAFMSFDFSKLKLKHPDNLELAKITDAFSAYYQIAGKALSILDNDFALVALTINGLRPDPLDVDVTVYRGMKVTLSTEDIDSYFKFGHRGFSVGEYQKLLGFYVDQPWNEIGGRWEYGGTYSSLSALMASGFAGGITTMLKAESVLLEIRLPKNEAKVCGSWKNEYELVPSSIFGENIVAIYILDIFFDKDQKRYEVFKVHKNPYIDSGVRPRFKEREEIKSDPSEIKIYNDLGCNKLPTLAAVKKSALYKNYSDFIERYTPKSFASDQSRLMEDYFSDRALYVEEFSYSLRGECNLNIMCCV